MPRQTSTLRIWESETHLSTEELQAAWQGYRRIRSDAARNRLIEHYLPTVKYCCEWLHARLPAEVELDDIMSAGVDGLRHAIRSFDPDRKVQFRTYLVARIRGTVLDYLRSIDWVPRLVRARAGKLARTADTLASKLGRPPTDAELAQNLGVAVSEVARGLRDADAVRFFSLDRCGRSHADGHEIHDGDLVEDLRAAHPGNPLHCQAVRELITKGLSTTERQVMMLYYYEQMTMREIGATLGLSESRVSQMHSAIVDRLRARLKGREADFGPMAS